MESCHNDVTSYNWNNISEKDVVHAGKIAYESFNWTVCIGRTNYFQVFFLQANLLLLICVLPRKQALNRVGACKNGIYWVTKGLTHCDKGCPLFGNSKELVFPVLRSTANKYVPAAPVLGPFAPSFLLLAPAPCLIAPAGVVLDSEGMM